MTLVLAFLTGLLTSGHCALMCGVFPATLAGLAPSVRRVAVLQTMYITGKAWAYVFLGALAALAGVRARALGLPLGVLAAVLLVAAGVAGLLPSTWAPGLRRFLRMEPLCGSVSALLRDARPLNALLVGIFNGFVPCAAVYAMLAYAATLGSVPTAAAIMLCFALGTSPALVLAGLSARALRNRIAPRLGAFPLARAAAVAPILLGLLTLVRVLDPAHVHVHPLIAAAIR